MKMARRFISLSIIVLMFIFVFPVSAENTEPVYSVTFKSTVGGSIPENCKFDIAVKCFEMDESAENAEPVFTDKLVLDTSVAQSITYTFKNSEVTAGGVYYQFSIAGTSNKLMVADNRVITVYLCSAELIKTADSNAEGEMPYDDIASGLALSFEYKCATIAVASKTVSKVYDGTTEAKLTSDDYKLMGIAEGLDVKLQYTEAAYNSAEVGKASKITVKGLSLTGADAAKYKLMTDKFECKAEITARTVTVTADTVMMTKGSAEPELTYQLSEPLIEGNTVIGSLARTSGNEVGEYTVTRGTLDFGTNYNINFVDGKLIISNYTLSEATDVTTGISVSGYFDAGSTVQADVIGADSSVYKALESGAAWGKILLAYDIKLSADAFDGDITVKIPVDSKYEGKQIAVYQQKSNGAVLTYKSVVTSGVVSVVTDECTQFMVVADKDPEAAGKTSVIIVILKILLIIVLVVVGIGLVLALFFFGMVFFNKTEELKKIIKYIKRILRKK